MSEPRIGVYVCHCGTNISQTVDIADVCGFSKTLANVALVKEYKYMCSDPGQETIKVDVEKNKLTHIVVSSCSPLMHEGTFRGAVENAGLNEYLFQMANIREHVSWVTEDKIKATEKAKKLIAAAVRRVVKHQPLKPTEVDINPDTVVIGGGIAGIEAALTIANAGKKVYLVEKDSTIGGHMAKFDKTFPTLDCAACILTPKMVSIAQNRNIELMTLSEVEEIKGFVGNFTVKIRKKARYVDEELCTGCGDCEKFCPVKNVPNEFEENLSNKKAIYRAFPQAVPAVYAIDMAYCKRCGVCVKKCGKNAINLDAKDEVLEVRAGNIIVATGYDLYDNKKYLEKYGYNTYENVLTSLEFERYTHASGPTGGKVVKKDGTEPEAVAILHCVGSRDVNANEHCSRICCMQSLKFGHLVKEKVPGAEVYNLYIDIRAFGKGYEEFYKRCIHEDIHFIRGKGAEVIDTALTKDEQGKLIIKVEDTLLGEIRRIPVDMVILSIGMEPSKSASRIASSLSLSRSKDGFFLEKHPKLAPVATATDGIYVAGAAQGPKDIPDTVAQANAAAGAVLSIINKGRVLLESVTSTVESSKCAGCKLCISVCPYQAIEFSDEDKASRIIEAMCKGCGTCVAVCPSGAITQKGYLDGQIFEEIEGILQKV
ncbi:MAG TPA: CoB--CoM heterodisulfide reductase iron-sulfur subunit A family protein [bacterium]|nr:CoB--CoM heterodisulfide reductase iron-sulfur subunit A family protein [bacterium]